MAKTELQPTEHQITVQVAQYLQLLKNQGKVLIFTKTAQETYTKSWSVKAKNKSEGVHAGLTDMIVVFRSVVLFLELKREKGGVVSQAQKEWQNALLCGSKPSVQHCIAYGFSEAKKAIDICLEKG